MGERRELLFWIISRIRLRGRKIQKENRTVKYWGVVDGSCDADSSVRGGNFDVILCPWGSNSAALEKYNTCVIIVYIYILNKSNIPSDKIAFPE